jgi:hypothetical protein
LLSFIEKLEQHIDRAARQVEKTTQANLAKAFRGDLAPTAERPARISRQSYENSDERDL